MLYGGLGVLFEMNTDELCGLQIYKSITFFVVKDGIRVKPPAFLVAVLTHVGVLSEVSSGREWAGSIT